MAIKNQKTIIAALTALLASLGLGGYTIVKKSSLDNNYQGLVELVEVIDGATIKVRFGEDDISKVRLTGIDSPELDACYGLEAKDALVEILADKRIRLDKDVEALDPYDRWLRYVVIENPDQEADNVLVNDWLVRQGYAWRFNSSPNNRYRDLLVRAEEEARTEVRGMWADCEYLATREQENADLRESDSSPPSADCIIKGNISEKGYGKTYLIPGCDNYERTKIDPKKGEQYFCTEAEAETAGFRKATNCP